MTMADPIPNTDMLDFLSEPCALFDSELTYAYVNAAYTELVGRESEELVGQYLFDAFPETPDRIEVVQAAMDKCLSGETSELDNLSYEIESEDGSMALKVWKICQDPVRNTRGKVTHILQRAQDITEQIIKDRQNAAVAREINHRAKNTMAIVTAIARITSRNATDYKSFLSSFTGRIDAMRRTHDRLNTDAWRGLTITETFETEMQQFAADTGADYKLTGPDIMLSVSGTKDLALVIHELLTNAVKYGCYNGEGGRLDVSWTRIEDGVEIKWSETCTHSVKAVETQGFGSRLFRMLPHVQVSQTYEPKGVQTLIHLTGDIAFA
jgi:PAS domain S-box-containing protein